MCCNPPDPSDVLAKLPAPLIWAGLALVLALPLGLAATSPNIAYRDAIYVMAGLSGIVALVLMLPQALLIAGLLPVKNMAARHLHRVTGAAIAAAVALHIAGLWVTSPQDMADALLLRAPAMFSFWGVLAAWVLVAISVLVLRRRRIAPRHWRRLHGILAAVFVAASIFHVLPIIGTMEPITKVAICLLVAAATLAVLARRLLNRPQRA